MSRVRLPRSAWLAVGIALGAAAAWIGVSAAVPLVAGLVGLALAASPLPARLVTARGSLAAVGVGAVLVALRVIVAPAGAASPSLDTAGDGPWSAEVMSVGSPKDGAQFARLAIQTSAEPVVVAATLPSFPPVRAGAVVTVAGRLEPPPDDDPYGEYLRRSGASGSLRATSLTVVRPPPWPSVSALRDGAGDALRLSLPEPEAGLAAGILIGLRERVDRALAADWATAGVSHVVAISGWNIAIVGALVATLLRGQPRKVVSVATLATVVAYTIAAGASSSVVRAAVMASVVLLARTSGRSVHATATLSLAVAGLLTIEPAMVGDAGFRLSVMATAGLLAWATPLSEWIGSRLGGRIPGWLAEGLGITLAAQAATLPDVLATFGRLSLVAPATNLAIVPLVPASMAGGAVALVGGWLVQLGAPPLVGVLAGLPGWLLLHVMVVVVRFAASVPLAAVTLPPELTVPAGAAASVGVAGVVALLRWRARRRGGVRSARGRPGPPARRPANTRRRIRWPRTALERAALAGVALASAVTLLAAADTVGAVDRIIVLDVGQGDAILVESRDGARMLVDGGPDPDRVLAELDAVVPPWDRRIDLVVLTHPHEDHVAGLARVLERYTVARVVESGMHGTGPGWKAWDTALHHGPPRGTLAAGARLSIGDIRLEALWPRPGTVPTEPAQTGSGFNNVSIVLLGTAAGHTFLLTGDAEEDVDPVLIATGLPHLDVLKVAHHGSATATTAALLAATRPSFALISVGARNDYGHPAPSTLSRLRDAGARVSRTDLDGRLEADFRPAGVEIHASGARRAAAGAPWTASGAPWTASGAPWTASGAPVALAPSTGYDRTDDRPGAPRGRPAAALARTASLVPAPRLRRGRRGGVAGRARHGSRSGCGPAGRRGGGAPARRGQAPVGRRGRPPPSRRAICSLA